MPNPTSKIRVIRIINPMLCAKCNCAYIADVTLACGKQKKMFYCSRLDCDNWIAERPVKTN